MSNKNLSFTLDEEIEVTCSVTPFVRGRGPSMDHAGGSPDEPSEVEDLYVGVIIKGISIDVTDKLTPKQKSYIEAKCFEQASDDDRD